jgi:hypothetical protein
VNNTLSITLPSSDRVENISPASAALVLAQRLLCATTIDPDYNDPSVSIISASIFLQKPLDGYYSYDKKEYVRSAANISFSIGPYISSAAKAWSDGFYSLGKFSAVSVDALQDHPRLALVGSSPFTITAGILVVVMLGLAVAFLWLSVGELLGIASIIKSLRSQKHAE